MACRLITKDAPSPTFTQYSGTQISSFSKVSADDVGRVLTSSPAKTCALDTLPTSVLLHVVDILPFICVMCNTSLRPSSQKKAIITPVLKKQNVDPDEADNRRSPFMASRQFSTQSCMEIHRVCPRTPVVPPVHS